MSNEELESLLDRYLRDMHTSVEAERTKSRLDMEAVRGMFNDVLKAMQELRGHVDTRLARVDQKMRGVEARVSMLEDTTRKRPAANIKALSTYEKTDTGS